MKRIFGSFLIIGFFFVFWAGPRIQAVTPVDVSIDNAGVPLKGKLFAAAARSRQVMPQAGSMETVQAFLP